MPEAKTVFSQIFEPIHPQSFRRCVDRYNGNHRVRTFSCWDQFLCMAFGQLAFRESLRDTVACLRSRHEGLYRMGIRGNVSVSTLADANEQRDWRIYADVAARLIARARDLYSDEELGQELRDHVCYALDATTIDLCMNLFPWAHFRSTKSAVKLHTLLDLRGNIPSFIEITTGKTHDVNALDLIAPEPGAFYIMDRAYVDFARLHRIHVGAAYFVTRAKKNMRFVRHLSQPIPADTAVRSDHIGRVADYAAYPAKIRRIRIYDEETVRSLVFLTNNMTLAAPVIGQLYKMRWQVELFFKWIKGHLRIKKFYGISPNAVKTQIWIAICAYVLVAIHKKQLKLEPSLHRILQVLSVSLFEQVPLPQLVTDSAHRNSDYIDSNQLTLWDL